MGAVGYTGGDPTKVNVTGYTKGDVLVADSGGTLAPLAVGPDAEVLTANHLAASQGVEWDPVAGGVPTTRQVNTTGPLRGGGTLASDLTLSVDSAATTGVGVVQLVGDLGGTATSPTVPGLTAKANQVDLIATTIAVTGQGVTLATKANDNAVVHLAGTETVVGLKTFSHAITGVVEDPETVFITRSALNANGSDMFRFSVGGRRTGYANEGGELRSRAYNETRIAFRCQSYVVGDNTVIHIFEATLSDNTVEFYVTAQGDAGVTRDLTVSRNLVVSNNLAVTGTATVAGSSVVKQSDYAAYANVTSFGANVAASSPVPQVRLEPGSVTRLRGVISASGTGGTGTLMTLPAGAPLQQMTISLRSTGTGAANLVININSNGTVTTGGTLPAGGSLAFDGVTFDRV